MKKPSELLRHFESFLPRHLGPNAGETAEMLKLLGYASLDALTDAAVPQAIRTPKALDLDTGVSEHEALKLLREMAAQNQVFKSYLGMGYADALTPPVIQRNILENPGWYTQYTPYQAEIAQGRLEALLNYQTMVMDLTAMPIANASLLDEATAAAEAMFMCLALRKKKREHVNAFFVAADCHPQVAAVVQTRATPLGVEVVVGDPDTHDFSAKPVFGALVQYPGTDGVIRDFKAFIAKAHAGEAMVVMAADILALTLLVPPGELGADIAVGSTQRFGVPLGYGGPHAAYFATKEEYKRQMPGRLVGVSKDADGKPAIRLALQTREQHIRREKATSNICTAQVLLAIMASMYAVYHGPKGVRAIAERVHALTAVLKAGLDRLGYATGDKPYFDTLRVGLGAVSAEKLTAATRARRINVRLLDAATAGVQLDEATSPGDLRELLEAFAEAAGKTVDQGVDALAQAAASPLTAAHLRTSEYLTHPVFSAYHSETEMLRYIHRLQNRDLSLTSSMIPLGSCTMKLNATSEMFPVTWPEFGKLHPFVPVEQAQGYTLMLDELQDMLKEVTGFAGVSLQPNAGSQGEYAGLLVIRKFHESRGDQHRTVCLIPSSAHGTNPASAALAGMQVVVVACDKDGNIDLDDLRKKAEEHKDRLAALMVTYPSTHGVFEEGIAVVCEIVHKAGGQVYMDGANMNAQVGLIKPGEFGPDVCHLNLHKTFCIPHGGGGPGMGPIGVKAHLAPFLPSHPVVEVGGGKTGVGPVSAAPYGSPSILPISWMYVRMMGPEGLKLATQTAILNANYIAKRLARHYPVLYTGKNDLVAHECILDCRGFKDTAGVEVVDIAKRLMDYGFHAPTISFPVAGTVMIEPTESESKAEIDRFIEAMIAIRAEIAEIESGQADRDNNLLKNAPHTAEAVVATGWSRPYSRERAAFPAPWIKQNKFWPAVARINDVLGDRQLVCACLPVEAYA